MVTSHKDAHNAIALIQTIALILGAFLVGFAVGRGILALPTWQTPFSKITKYDLNDDCRIDTVDIQTAASQWRHETNVVDIMRVAGMVQYGDWYGKSVPVWDWQVLCINKLRPTVEAARDQSLIECQE